MLFSDLLKLVISCAHGLLPLLCPGGQIPGVDQNWHGGKENLPLLFILAAGFSSVNDLVEL